MKEQQSERQVERQTQKDRDGKKAQQELPLQETMTVSAATAPPCNSRNAPRAPGAWHRHALCLLLHATSPVHLSPSPGNFYVYYESLFPSHHRNELKATVSITKKIGKSKKTVSNL